MHTELQQKLRINIFYKNKEIPDSPSEQVARVKGVRQRRSSSYTLSYTKYQHSSYL